MKWHTVRIHEKDRNKSQRSVLAAIVKLRSPVATHVILYMSSGTLAFEKAFSRDGRPKIRSAYDGMDMSGYFPWSNDRIKTVSCKGRMG